MPSLHAIQKRQQRDAHYERRRASLVSNDAEAKEESNAAQPRHSGVRGKLSSIARKMSVKHADYGKKSGPRDEYFGCGNGMGVYVPAVKSL